ncbi:diaminopimelate epimerase [Glacieibacterium frigidum]|uniref:Diaminopimelate epimerase n=1 Tax=Glacieibacterium frigidum TaxID=2593303 RepID=A0A552UGD9_9SPHN|nr:diaminopimelate epimerase [Glacieibacterium frigidum]TRW17292.1 diaminopimelate epimerase [Glacieibacterium frigidum]
MRRPFTKMHGLGNDFVLFDARAEPLPLTTQQVRSLSDRHTGIGCDQLFVLEPSDRADVFMRIWNSDGGEVQSCGNGARCVAAWLGGAPSIDTAGGLLHATATAGAASVDMGVPRFDWDAVPLAYAMDSARLPVAWGELEGPMALSIGNPHVVFFVPDTAAVPLETLGPEIETDALFPERVNVGVAQVTDAGLTLRVWERGAGLTRACGTGAVAAAVAGIRRGLVRSPVAVTLPGGTVEVAWAQGGGATLSGPATRVFDGEIDPDDFA